MKEWHYYRILKSIKKYFYVTAFFYQVEEFLGFEFCDFICFFNLFDVAKTSPVKIRIFGC